MNVIEGIDDEGPADTGPKPGPLSQFKQTLVNHMKNPTVRYATLAGMFCSLEQFSVAYFMPVFFLQVYPKYKTEYSLYNGLIVSILGFISNITGGIVSDRFEKKSRMTKAYVCMFACAITIPLLGLSLLQTRSFYFSLFFFAMRMLLGECFLSPQFTMM